MSVLAYDPSQYDIHVCADCGETFGVPVWECPACQHHLSVEFCPDECKYCYTERAS